MDCLVLHSSNEQRTSLTETTNEHSHRNVDKKCIIGLARYLSASEEYHIADMYQQKVDKSRLIIAMLYTRPFAITKAKHATHATDWKLHLEQLPLLSSQTTKKQKEQLLR